MSSTTLWCIVEREDTPFTIHTSPTIYIADLKDLIQEKIRTNNPARKLKLWQVRYFYPFFLTLWVITLPVGRCGPE